MRLEKTFFHPLGMTQTTVAAELNTRPRRRAIGYQPTEEGFAPYDYESSTLGAGGIYSTLEDLARFAMALQQGTVVSKDSLTRAMEPARRTDGRPTPYGMGWLSESGPVGERKEVPYIAAIGSLWGFRAMFQWYYQDDLIILWASNSASPEVFDGLLGISEIAQTIPSSAGAR